MSICLLDLRCSRDLLGNRPHTAHQFTGNRDDDVIGMFSAGQQASKAFTQAHLRLPTDILDRLRELFQPELRVAPDFGGIARRPGAFDERSTGMGITSFGEGTLPASLPPGVFRGDAPQEFHQLSGVIEAREVPEFSDGSDGHGELDATQGLERCDDRR